METHERIVAYARERLDVDQETVMEMSEPGQYEASVILPVLEHFAKTLDRLVESAEKTTKLLDALVTPQKELREKGLKKKALFAPANADTALRARVGRVARSYGMTMEQWTARHGMRDKKLPRGVDAWLTTEQGLENAGLPARTRFLQWVDGLELGEVVGVDRALDVFSDFDRRIPPRRPTAETLRRWLKEHPEMRRLPPLRPARFVKGGRS